MTFAVAADAYDRFMGRYSEPLAPMFAEFADISDVEHVLDVGCGPGALTAELVRRFGPSSVTAVDPSEPFVAAARERFPNVRVEQASARELPYAEGTFDAALAQLVVHFMADPVAELREIARVTRPGGTVGACVWDHAGDGGPLSVFWVVARELDADVHDESRLPGARKGQLVGLFREAGLADVAGGTLEIEVEHPSFEDWWQPYTLGVGPVGAYVASLPAGRRAELRERCRERLPAAPFVLRALAWAARGRRASD